MNRSVIRPQIRDLGAYEVPDAHGMVKLDAMENPYPLPAPLQQELAQILSQLAFNRYPEPQPKLLRELLYQQMGVPHQAGLLLGNGSDEIIQMIALATAQPGAVMLGVEPSFVMFRMIATFVGMEFVGIPLNAQFQLDEQPLLQAIGRHQPAVLFLAYPNNPTGNCFDAALLRTVLQQTSGLVVVDEAYFPFTDQSFLPELLNYPNLLVMRTLSKLGLAGIRLGFLAGPRALVDQLEKVRLPYNISVPDQAVATYMLRHLSVLQEQTGRIRQQREVLRSQLALLEGVTVYPSEANFLLLRVASAARIFDALRHRGILIKNLGKAHALLADCLRVTVGSPEENQQFLTAFQNVLARTVFSD